MNILLVDINQCDLDQARAIHEELTAKLGDTLTMPISHSLEDMIKYLVDFVNTKESDELNGVDL